MKLPQRLIPGDVTNAAVGDRFWLRVGSRPLQEMRVTAIDGDEVTMVPVEFEFTGGLIPPWGSPIPLPPPKPPQYPAPLPLAPWPAAIKALIDAQAERLYPTPPELQIDWQQWFGDPLADVRAELQAFLDDYHHESEATA